MRLYPVMSELRERFDLVRAKYWYLTNYDSEDPTSPIDPLTYRDSGGDSLLHIAAFLGDAETVSVLLDAGVDPNLAGDMNATPLHAAMAGGQLEVYQIILGFGANESALDDFGRLPKEVTPISRRQ